VDIKTSRKGNMTIKINIAKDFSRSPGGRHITDGPYSGERFRQEFLLPALKAEGTVEVELDGLLTSGSSFLEEAFGGLVRVSGLNSDDLHNKLKIKSSVKTYEQRIWLYIDEAKPETN
jgi:hypothetical protein